MRIAVFIRIRLFMGFRLIYANAVYANKTDIFFCHNPFRPLVFCLEIGRAKNRGRENTGKKEID